MAEASSPTNVGLGVSETVSSPTSLESSSGSPPTPTTYATYTTTVYDVQGFGSDATTLTTSTETITVANQAEYASLTSAKSSTSATSAQSSASPGSGSSSSSHPDSTHGLSLGAKVGIGVAIPLVIILAVALGFYCLRRRRRKHIGEGNGHLDTSDTLKEKPELYAGPADPRIAGSVRSKPELSTDATKYLPPELDDNMIREADSNTRRSRYPTQRKPVPTVSTASSQATSSNPMTLVDSISGRASQSATSEAADRELIGEADAAVAELGLLAVRKRALSSQANATGKRPEEVEGRKGEEYRTLVEREHIVRKRLDDIEAERRR